MRSYSQNGEDLKILNYFEGFKGTLLSLGENNGTILSNARLLIENGWKATLVEPSPDPFSKLVELYANDHKICLVRSAIGVENGTARFFDSGTHLNKGDTSLLSTLKTEETEKWKTSTDFTEIEVPVMTFDKLIETSKYKQFNFISIDCEGYDLLILRQMDLRALGVSVLIIEWNGVVDLKKAYITYCAEFGLIPVHSNNENIIFTLP